MHNRSCRTHVLCALAFCLLFGLATVSTDNATSLRPAHVDDLFAWESVGSTTFAPDGEALAFTRMRPLSTVPAALQSVFVPDVARSDVWVQDAPGRPPRNLTNGLADGSGAWEPLWAPDSQRLAFLSSRGGGIAVGVWERATASVHRVATPGVRYDSHRPGGSCRWVDAHRLLCLVEPDGGVSHFESILGRAARLPTEAWARAARGENTASVLNSTEFRSPRARLWMVDVRSNAGREVGNCADLSWPLRSFWLSPNGRTVAFVRPDPVPYGMASAARMGAPHPIELRRLDGRPVPLDRPLPDNIHTQTLSWSPDGTELAFFANGPGLVNPIVLYGTAAAAVMPERVDVRENPARLYRVNLAAGRVESWGTGDIDLGELGSPEFFWTSTGELVLSAPRRRYGVTSGPPASRGAPWGWTSWNAVPVYRPSPVYWWVIGRDGRTRFLVPEGTAVPASLQPIDGGAGFIGVRDGEVWRVDPVKGTSTNLTLHLVPRVRSIAAIEKAPQSATQLLVLAGSREPNGPPPSSEAAAEAGASEAYYRVDSVSGATAEFPRSAPSASLVAFAVATLSAAYLDNTRRGTFLWRTTQSGQKHELLVETNTYARRIARQLCRIVRYTSLNGEPLLARLCLPTDYTRGRQYPLLVEVRMGYRVPQDRGDDYTPATNSQPVVQDLYAAAGYAHLVPSIPKSLPGVLPEEDDAPIMALNGILPAVEQAVALGVADPQRLFVEGGSRGGWTTLSVIGQTTRFTAAVVRAYGASGRKWPHGISDRYSENPMNTINPNGGPVKSYRPSDVPWWRDGDQFRRSHPLSYVDRVQTPVFIMHGDLDSLPLGESEDYFYALVSMRKPAQFVRYWGEGHGIRIPANVRDEYRRKLAWFDRWGDIARDAQGRLIFDGDRVKSRHGAPPLTPEDFARIGPIASTSVSESGSR